MKAGVSFLGFILPSLILSYSENLFCLCHSTVAGSILAFALLSLLPIAIQQGVFSIRTIFTIVTSVYILMIVIGYSNFCPCTKQGGYALVAHREEGEEAGVEGKRVEVTSSVENLSEGEVHSPEIDNSHIDDIEQSKLFLSDHFNPSSGSDFLETKLSNFSHVGFAVITVLFGFSDGVKFGHDGHEFIESILFFHLFRFYLSFTLGVFLASVEVIFSQFLFFACLSSLSVSLGVVSSMCGVTLPGILVIVLNIVYASAMLYVATVEMLPIILRITDFGATESYTVRDRKLIGLLLGYILTLVVCQNEYLTRLFKN